MRTGGYNAAAEAAVVWMTRSVATTSWPVQFCRFCDCVVCVCVCVWGGGGARGVRVSCIRLYSREESVRALRLRHQRHRKAHPAVSTDDECVRAVRLRHRRDRHAHPAVFTDDARNDAPYAVSADDQRRQGAHLFHWGIHRDCCHMSLFNCSHGE